MQKKCLKVEEVADVLQVPKARVYELCRRGLLPHIRLGRQIRIPMVVLDKFIEDGGKALPGGWKWEA